MNPERPTRASEQKDEQAATGGGAPHVFDGVNVNAELVADLLAATGLLPDDKLNALRGVAGQGSLAEALVSGGFAASEGVARMLAARHHVPLTDLALTGIDKKTAELVPLHVLERLVAIPYALNGDSLRVAIADPADLHAIDELLLATRHQVESSPSFDASRARPRPSAPAPHSPRKRRCSRRKRRTSTISTSKTASRRRRSFGSSTRSSSRRPRTEPRTSTSSRRRTPSPSGSASTASCTRCSGSPSE